MSAADKIAAIGAIVSGFCAAMSLLQAATRGVIWGPYLIGLLAFPIAWVATR